MHLAAHVARPLSYSKILQAFRPLRAAELAICADQVMAWRAGGTVPEVDLRTLASRLENELSLSTEDVLQIAESSVLLECARRYAGMHRGFWPPARVSTCIIGL